jgi:hypothetical protein
VRIAPAGQDRNVQDIRRNWGPPDQQALNHGIRQLDELKSVSL